MYPKTFPVTSAFTSQILVVSSAKLSEDTKSPRKSQSIKTDLPLPRIVKPLEQVEAGGAFRMKDSSREFVTSC
jgi:hypothetical protein